MSVHDTKTVLIAGATSDIALAFAHEFAAGGASVQLAGRNIKALEREQADLRATYDAEISVHELDILDFSSFKAFFNALQPLPDIIICAVGYMGNQEETAGEIELSRNVIDTNFSGPAIFMETAASILAPLSGDKALVGISSVAGDRGRAKNYVYGSAKAGFSQYLSGMRQKYSQTNLHIMTVKPGFVDTAATKHMELPGVLTSSSKSLASAVIKAIRKKRQIYYPWKWLLIMLIIKILPERIFMKMQF